MTEAQSTEATPKPPIDQTELLAQLDAANQFLSERIRRLTNVKNIYRKALENEYAFHARTCDVHKNLFLIANGEMPTVPCNCKRNKDLEEALDIEPKTV